MAESAPETATAAAEGEIAAETSAVATATASAAVQPLPQPDNEAIIAMCRDMFKKTADYVVGEFAGTSDDYRLLEQMNRATLTKYAEMKDISVNLTKTMTDLKEKYNSLQPYLEMIDQVEESVASLEQAAYKLDNYSKRLEAKFKLLEKK